MAKGEEGKHGKGRGKGKDEAKGEGKFEVKVTELHAAARNGDIAQLDTLLTDEAMVKDINSFDNHRRTPLHLAAFFGKAGAVERLLAKGADVQREAMDGFLPLHFAAQSGHLEVIRLLIRKVGTNGSHGAVKQHVNRVVTKGKKSALHLALIKGHTDCARFLVVKGASTELKTAKGETAFDLCKSEVLRHELLGDAKAAEASDAKGSGNDASVGAAEPPAKRRACGPAPQPVAGVGAGGPKEAVAIARVCAVKDAPPMSSLPMAPPPAAQALGGVVACGPWRLDETEVATAEAERSYPAGVAALADAHWPFAVKQTPGLTDGPVWSILSCECGSPRPLRLKLQQSTRRLLEYTDLSEEGMLLPRDARCGACGITVLAETADSKLVLTRGGGESPLLCPPIAGRTLDSADLMQALESALAAEARLVGDLPLALGSARLLAVLEMGEGPSPTGHRHELVFGVRLARTAAEVRAAFVEGEGGGGKSITFARLSGQEGVAAEAPESVEVRELLADESKRLAGVTRRALSLLKELCAGG